MASGHIHNSKNALCHAGYIRYRLCTRLYGPYKHPSFGASRGKVITLHLPNNLVRETEAAFGASMYNSRNGKGYGIHNKTLLTHLGLEFQDTIGDSWSPFDILVMPVKCKISRSSGLLASTIMSKICSNPSVRRVTSLTLQNSLMQNEMYHYWKHIIVNIFISLLAKLSLV